MLKGYLGKGFLDFGLTADLTAVWDPGLLMRTGVPTRRLCRLRFSKDQNFYYFRLPQSGGVVKENPYYVQDYPTTWIIAKAGSPARQAAPENPGSASSRYRAAAGWGEACCATLATDLAADGTVTLEEFPAEAHAQLLHEGVKHHIPSSSSSFSISLGLRS